MHDSGSCSARVLLQREQADLGRTVQPYRRVNDADSMAGKDLQASHAVQPGVILVRHIGQNDGPDPWDAHLPAVRMPRQLKIDRELGRVIGKVRFMGEQNGRVRRWNFRDRLRGEAA